MPTSKDLSQADVLIHNFMDTTELHEEDPAYSACIELLSSFDENDIDYPEDEGEYVSLSISEMHEQYALNEEYKLEQDAAAELAEIQAEYDEISAQLDNAVQIYPLTK